MRLLRSWLPPDAFSGQATRRGKSLPSVLVGVPCRERCGWWRVLAVGIDLRPRIREQAGRAGGGERRGWRCVFAVGVDIAPSISEQAGEPGERAGQPVPEPLFGRQGASGEGREGEEGEG